MPGIRKKALSKLADNKDLSKEEYFDLLRQKKQERIDKIIEEQKSGDYFKDLFETESEVEFMGEEDIPLEEKEKRAFEHRKKLRRKFGLE